MSPPKFRGDADDWLDRSDAGRSGESRAKRERDKGRGGSAILPEQANATVSEVFPKQCEVELDGTLERIPCMYRKTQVLLRGSEWRERAPVAVGDRVRVERPQPAEGVISGVAPRTTRLHRPAPDRGDHVRHVLVANMRRLCIVTSVHDPDFSSGLVDRLWIAAQLQKMEVLVCVNKIDLAPGLALGPRPPWQLYRDLGIECLEVSAKERIGIEALQARLLDRPTVFCGHSGVGKTSLLRVLLGNDVGRVGGVNTFTGKGKHTTTGAVLLHGPQSVAWVDTPGVREFGLVGIKPEGLAAFFPEFARLECAEPLCQHIAEPGCQAQSLPRYPSYLRIWQSLTEAHSDE